MEAKQHVWGMQQWGRHDSFTQGTHSPFQAESDKNNRKQIISVMKLRVPWEFQEHMGCLGGRPVYTDLEHP